MNVRGLRLATGATFGAVIAGGLMALFASPAVPVAAGLGAVAGGWLATGRLRTEAVTPERTTNGGTRVWSAGAHNPGWLALALLLAAAGAAAVVGGLVVPSGEPAWVVFVAALVFVTLCTEVRVTIGRAGLTVAIGPFGYPRQHVALADIADVEVEHVEPLRYGGWGWRWLPRSRAVVVRRGEGLRIHRRGRAPLVVTVDDAQRGAEILAGHLERGGGRAVR